MTTTDIKAECINSIFKGGPYGYKDIDKYIFGKIYTDCRTRDDGKIDALFTIIKALNLDNGKFQYALGKAETKIELLKEHKEDYSKIAELIVGLPLTHGCDISKKIKSKIRLLEGDYSENIGEFFFYVNHHCKELEIKVESLMLNKILFMGLLKTYCNRKRAGSEIF